MKQGPSELIIHQHSLVCASTAVPHSIAAENISVSFAAESDALHIQVEASPHSFILWLQMLQLDHLTNLQVDVVCTSRVPELFLITLMTFNGGVLREFNMSHDPGQEVANFTISLPQTVDGCSVHVRISAGNSAGMSAPSEAVEVGKLAPFSNHTAKPVSFLYYSLFRWHHTVYYCCQ